ncbi:MAG: DUF4389 domain-containing protein [Dehalococcoidia bacterium]|nr:DUF4389 domain-containing protein [Dehalococcoidia bacterium]MCA9843940.1 DUF4389 domain-containing protein [Dehalococcoidia bacterium]
MALSTAEPYPARLEVDYPEQLDRVSTALRIFWAIPILIIAALISAVGSSTAATESGETATQAAGGIAGGLFLATVLMILFRQVYPRWWFNFALELERFNARVGAYLALLTDTYPSTTDEQAVHLEVDFPENVPQDLNRWLPLVKWFLAIPHYIVLFFLSIAAAVVIIIAWFAILFTGQYPRGMFDFVVGVGRWGLRVQAYAFLLVTDRYPPFSLQP